MQKVVVFKEKHEERIYDASTPELLDRAFLTVLRERFEDGLYVMPENPGGDLDKYREIPSGVIAALPVEMQREITDKLELHGRRVESYNEQKSQWDLLKELVTTPFEEAISKFGRGRNRYSSIEFAMSMRGDCQYEGYEVIVLQKTCKPE